MIIDTKQIITMTEANQNFSKASKTVDTYGKAVIIKNNKPKYVILDFDDYINLTEEEKLDIISKRVLNKHIAAFKELSK